MKKRRTRKDKKSVDYSFLIKWQPSSIKEGNERSVNRQLEKAPVSTSFMVSTNKKAKLSAKDNFASSTIKDIRRSLFLSSLMLCLELVLYLIWSK